MDKQFPILAIETTGDLCSVAVLLDSKNYIELNYLQKHIHSEKLMEMIDIVIRQSNVLLKDFSAIAISMGPGSFTGLRVGMSAAKGLAFGSGLGLIPVPTFDALALQLKDHLANGQIFNLIENASVDDCYFSKYYYNQDKLTVMNDLVLLDKVEIEKNCSPGEINFGNVNYENLTIKDVKTSALSICRWAYLFGKDLLTFDYDNLEPNYLKQFVGKVKK